MKQLLTFPLIFAISLAQESNEQTLKEGHSHNGHAFNEGPRQAGPLLKTTGEVHLAITTTWEEGQAFFDQGLGQLHGFWYYEAERSFRQILAHDPECAMAYWGLSQANIENPKRAKEFISKAEELLKKTDFKITDHERAYLNAEISYHDDKKEKDAKTRMKNFLRSYEDLILKYPEDLEAKALLVCRHWQFDRKGVPISSHLGLDAILEQIFAKSPNHPAHHYAIHLWDYRNYEQALDSSARLGQAAPGIAHMWHMPGHIYSKAKRYHDAIWHQQASARVDHAHMMKHFLLPDQIHNYAHNNEWCSRNFANLGMASAAIEMAKSLLANPRHPQLNTASKGSSRYGRKALITFLEQFELWQQAIDYAHSPWLEKLPKDEDDLSRLRLIAVAHSNLGQQAKLLGSIEHLASLLEKEKQAQHEAEKQARDQATEEKKDEKEIEAQAKKARDQHNGKIKKLENTLAELRGYLAAMNGDFKTANEALSKRPGQWNPMLRQLAYGDHEKAAQSALKQIEKNDKQVVALAQAIHVLYHADKNNEAWKKGFEELRTISSEIEIDSPIFARLMPIAKELGYPHDWRLKHQPASDLLPRPELSELGPLHWSPPTAPSFTLPNQHQEAISLESYRGKPLILVFYLGAGCLHCTEQLTTMADRYEDFKKAGLPILAISTDDVSDLKKSQDNYEKGTIPFPIVSDSQKSIFKQFTAHDDFEDQPLHGTFVIDPKGRILWSDISADPFMEIDFLITEATRLLQLHH